MNQHLTQQDFCNNLTIEQIQHIAECTYCCEQYADYIETSAFLSAPHDLRASILRQMKPLPRTTYRFQLFQYSLKIGFAMCVAFLLLVIGPTVSPIVSEKTQTITNYKQLEKLSSQINQLTLQFLNMEEPSYDKKEK